MLFHAVFRGASDGAFCFLLFHQKYGAIFKKLQMDLLPKSRCFEYKSLAKTVWAVSLSHEHHFDPRYMIRKNHVLGVKNAINWNLQFWPYYPSSKIDDFRRFHFFLKKLDKGVKKQLLTKSNRLVPLWQSRTASKGRKQWLSIIRFCCHFVFKWGARGCSVWCLNQNVVYSSANVGRFVWSTHLNLWLTFKRFRSDN